MKPAGAQQTDRGADLAGGHRAVPTRAMGTFPKYVLALLCLYLVALTLMHLPPMRSLDREEITISGPGGRPGLGTLWKCGETPKAVLIAGHGVTANRGIMFMIAYVFALNGYDVLALDFWGHGRSREPFDWEGNPGLIHAWCDWAHERYPGVSLAYLGYSMGGFAGAKAFYENPRVDAFVALGATPDRELKCPTLVAKGAHEELFTDEQALKSVGAWGGLVTSPFSDHVLEAHDPLLLWRILEWVNATLKISADRRFPLAYWLGFNVALLLGTIATLLLAERGARLFRAPYTGVMPPPRTRRWSLNPYRIAGHILGCRGPSAPPRSGTFLAAMVRGTLFSLSVVLLLTGLLNRHVFTCAPDHPERLLTWGILILAMALPVFLDAWLLERLPFVRSRQRVLVAALTRALPLLIVGEAMRILGPPVAFGGMTLMIFACILALLSLVHALATRAAADWRAGATATTVLFAWLIAFWFPLSWPWV